MKSHTGHRLHMRRKKDHYFLKFPTTASARASVISGYGRGDPTLERLAVSQKKIEVPNVSPELMAMLASGANLAQNPAQSTFSDCDAQIQVVTGLENQNALNSGFVHPLLLGMHGKKPTLNLKYQGGWQSFKKQWDQHSQVLLACNRGQPLPDSILLQYFSGCLDSSDQILLEMMQEKNEDLSFQDFWETLRSLYDRDTQGQLRLAWETVQLPKGDLSLEKWLKFAREWELRRERVEDRTPQEEYKLIMSKIPDQWQKRILEEQEKRSRNRFVVRLSNLPDKPPLQIKHAIEAALGVDILKVQPLNNGAAVHCSTAAVQALVLGLEGHTLQGKIVKCTAMEPNLTADEVIEYVQRKLEVDERYLAFRQTLAPSLQPQQVNTVESNPPLPKRGSEQGFKQRLE